MFPKVILVGYRTVCTRSEQARRSYGTVCLYFSTGELLMFLHFCSLLDVLRSLKKNTPMTYDRQRILKEFDELEFEEEVDTSDM